MSADWLKEFTITNTTEIIPNVGYSNVETTRIRLEKKEYRNLDGVIRFINRTLASNHDVYFVTARKAIEWMKILKRIEIDNGSEKVSSLLDELFESEECESRLPFSSIFNGECSILGQSKPDYKKEDLFKLDDSFGEDMRKKLKIDNRPNSLLTLLQTEVLFVNDFVMYFVVSLAAILLVVIIRDRFF